MPYEDDNLNSDSQQPGQFVKLYADLQPDEREDILREQQDRLTASIKFMERLYPQMIENFKKYRSIAEPLVDALGNQIKNRANLFIPYPWAIIESALPRLAGKLPRVRIFPRKEIDRQQVETKQDLLYYAMDRMNFLRTQTLWVRQFEIYGWSPLYTFWREEVRNMLVRETNQQTGMVALTRKPVKMYDDFWARVIDVFDAFLQPGVLEPEEGDWFMFREWLSAKDLKLRVQAGLFYPEVLEYTKSNKEGSAPIEDTGRSDRDSLVGQDKDPSKHAYGQYEVMYTCEDGRIVAMLNRTILAMVGDNPNPLQVKPVINCNLVPMVSEPIGISTIEALAGLPDKMNAISNAAMDGLSFTLGPVILANRNANSDWENFVMDPGNLILTDAEVSDKNFRILNFPDNSGAAGREVMNAKEEMQFVSGVSDYIVGVNSGARMADTATGVSTIVREANARYALKQAAFESGSLRKFVQFADAYLQTFLTDERRIYVVGPQGYLQRQVTPEDIAYESDIIIEPGSSAPLDQLTRREGLMNLLDRILRLPTVVKVDKYLREVLESFDFRNIDDMLVQSGPEIANMMEDAQLAKGENIALLQGQQVELVGDDNVHMQVHQEMQQQLGMLPDQAKMMAIGHIQSHIQRKMQRDMMMQQQMMMGGMNANPNGPQPGAPNAVPQPQGPPAAGGMAPPAGGGPR